MKRFPEHQLNAKVRRTRDTTALSRLALLLFCGLVLAGGFVFAAKQHFAAVQYGYQNEHLRNERKRSEEHTSELQSQSNLVCRLLLEKKKNIKTFCMLNATSRLTAYELRSLSYH